MPNQEDEQQRAREQRVADEKAKSAGEAKKKRAQAIAAVIGVVVVIVAVVVVLISSGDSKTAPTSTAVGPAPKDAIAISEASQAELLKAAKLADCVFKTNPSEGRDHKEKPSYKFIYKANPPTSGNHFPVWADDAAYLDQAPPVQRLVHSLEHGRVIFQWDKAKVTKEQIGSLKQLYDDYPYHLILTENTTKMPGVIAATAWNHSLVCQKVTNDT
ncbi:MAG: DUF3105 domain-containing protein, partial [Thermoleophilaceae bacterium]|nr:DUF3105 domain-containing protein [Thermoleophilaceae bacterium]